MPSRWISEAAFRFRRSPVAIACSAGGIGLVCGALAVAMTSSPSPTPSAVATKPVVETTGTAVMKAEPRLSVAEAPAKVEDGNERVSKPECERQTWPYITQKCLAEQEAGRRKVRVITTDKIAPPVVAAIETERKGEAPPVKDVPQAAKPTPAPVTQAETKSVLALQSPAIEQTPVTAASPAPAPPVAAAPTQPHVAAVQSEPAPAAQPAAIEQPQAETPQKSASKSKRSKTAGDARGRRVQEAKSRRLPVDVDANDGAEETFTRTSSSTRGAGQSRVVERWTEREYDVPSESGSQRRRVIVRSGEWDGPSNSGLFGILFGR